jgi:transcriptional regulator with XRE-family HTH domain
MEKELDETRILKLLSDAGLPQFKLDKCGYPVPGQVVRYYRERMKYTDREGKVKHWSQADLARQLGVTELMVRLMETKNKGLDSIERRRALAQILKIPPVLLGLSSLDDLTVFLQKQDCHSDRKVYEKKEGGIDNHTMQLYRDAFTLYNDTHSVGTAQGSIDEIEQWVERIHEALLSTLANMRQRTELQHLLWNFHALSAKIYGDDLFDWEHAFHHLNQSLTLAVEMNSSDLQAASLYRSAQIHFAQRNYSLAKSDLDGSLVHARNASPSIKGASFASAGLAYAIVEKDQAGMTYAQKLLDEAEKYASTSDNSNIITFNTGKYLLDRADALMSLGRPSKALEVLDDAEELTNTNQRRRIAYLNILRAECYIRLKKPDYAMAAMLLSEALTVSEAVHSSFNISHIKRLHKLIASSPYGNSPDVVELGIRLGQR